jgi:NDP-sugar pyrophosphorylase family protein
MCVFKHVVKIPFGVIKADNYLIYDIKEKPSETYLINAGIYLLNPDVINFVPQDDFYNMTSLFQLLITAKKRVGIFHLNDYWTDIGNLDDFKRASDGQYFE